MKLNNLEKATKLYAQIKELDSQIIEIDKMAMLVANGTTKQNFKLSVEDLHKTRMKQEDILDEDGSLKQHKPFDFEIEFHVPHSIKDMIFPYGAHIPKHRFLSAIESNSLTDTISDSATLQILGVLLSEKNRLRAELIKKLEKNGVSVR